MERAVVVELNQQQEQIVRRLIDEGDYGSTPAEVIRDIFIRFCETHPEVFLLPAGKSGKEV